MTSRPALFAMGAAQVVFVAANTVFIAQQQLTAAFLSSFVISQIWCFNVKKIAIGDARDRFAYAVGAATGCVAGAVAAHALLSLL